MRNFVNLYNNQNGDLIIDANNSVSLKYHFKLSTLFLSLHINHHTQESLFILNIFINFLLPLSVTN